MSDTGPDFGAPAIAAAGANAQADCLIERMPPEVLREIFLNSTSNFGSDWVSGTASTEMVLSHVCGVWRELSLATPELWTSISLSYSNSEGSEGSTNSPLRRPPAILQCWLQRSRSRLIHIRLRYSNDPMMTDGLPSLLGMLSVHSHRWKSVEFYFPRGPASLHGEYGHELRNIFQTLDAKSLESATVHFVKARRSPRSGYLTRWVKHFLRSAPHLQCLDWSVTQQAQFYQDRLPFHSLKHLRVRTYLPLRTVLFLLETYRALRKLVVSIDSHTLNDHGSMINHSNLQSLSFKAYNGPSIHHFFDKLNVPSLQDFFVLSSHPRVNLSGFTQMLERSHANLEWLYICDFDASQMQPPILTILHHPRVHDSLLRLSIASSYIVKVPIPDDLFEQLVFKLEDAFLPNLQSLTITVNLDTQADLLRRFILSRPHRDTHETAQVPLPLWRIRLYPCGPVQASKGIGDILQMRGVEFFENSRWVSGSQVQYSDEAS